MDTNEQIKVSLKAGEWLWLLGLLSPHTIHANACLDDLITQVMSKVNDRLSMESGGKRRQEEADSRLRSARERVMLALGEAGPVCGWYEIEGGKRHLSDWEWRLDAHKKRASLPFRDRLSASFPARDR